MAEEGFFARLARIARQVAGSLRGQQGEEAHPPAVPEEQPVTPPEEIPQEYQPEETEVTIYQPPEEEVEITETTEEEGGCIEGYYPGRVEGRRVRVKPRWYVYNPDLDCLRRMLDTVPRFTFYTIVVCGVPSNEYPGKEGESRICLGYVRHRNVVIQSAYGYTTTSAVDFANEINNLDPNRQLEGWESVDTIAIIDK